MTGIAPLTSALCSCWRAARSVGVDAQQGPPRGPRAAHARARSSSPGPTHATASRSTTSLARALGDRAPRLRDPGFTTPPFVPTPTSSRSSRNEQPASAASGGPNLAMATRSSSSDTATFRSMRHRRGNCLPTSAMKARVSSRPTGLRPSSDAPIRELLGVVLRRTSLASAGTVINEAAISRRPSISRRCLRSVMVHQAKLFSRTRACCCGSTCPNAARMPELRNRSFRWRGRRISAKAGCSIRRSRMTPRRGTTATPP